MMATNKPGYEAAFYAKERQKIIDRVGGCCFLCGIPYPLDIHHTKHDNTNYQAGRMERLKGWKRDPDFLLALCPTCHKLLHTICPEGQ